MRLELVRLGWVRLGRVRLERVRRVVGSGHIGTMSCAKIEITPELGTIVRFAPEIRADGADLVGLVGLVGGRVRRERRAS